MKKDEFNEALDHIEPRIVEEFIKEKEKYANKRAKRQRSIRICAVAACLAVLLGAVFAGPLFRPKVPVWEDAQYSAEDIAGFFASFENGLTNSYQEEYVPDSKYLYIDDIPDKQYLGIYKRSLKGKPLCEKEYRKFINGILPKLADYINVPVPQYEITKFESDNYGDSLEVWEDIGAYNIRSDQSESNCSFSIYPSYEVDDRKIVLDGETVQINQRLSDEEIIDSLQSVKDKLFDIFDVSFKDVEIIRRYDAYSEYGATGITIYFYNESPHLLDQIVSSRGSEYIYIRFENRRSHQGAVVSDSILTDASIHYVKRRVDLKEIYEHVAEAKVISLKDAESLLYNGYVFGGHSCSICMSMQDKISFRNYDFVGIAYMFEYDEDIIQPVVGIPFYAFYKNIGRSENGNLIYAKTYVPAIEVSGYKEYFESQEANHKGLFG